MKTKENKKSFRKSPRAKKAEQAKEFPGYPPYSPEEDIMNQAKRVDVNLEEGENIDHINDEYSKKNRDIQNPEEPLIDNKSELTKDDLEALGPKDLSLDMGEDEELLKHRTRPVDFAAKDLDIPTETDATVEDGGTGDEENNFYSIGGDAHDNLEEGKP